MECEGGHLYVNALTEEFSSAYVGWHSDDVGLNNINYAVDMLLLIAILCGLTSLLSIFEKFALSYGLLFNVKRANIQSFTSGVTIVNLYLQPSWLMAHRWIDVHI